MKIKNILLTISCLLFSFSNTTFAQSMGKSPFPEHTERIVFLGNSITYGGKYVTDVEAYFKMHYPNYKYEFINTALPSEMTSGLSEEGHADGEFPRPCIFSRLNSLLEKTKPDVAFVCYGMNDGIFLPFDNERFEAFKNGMQTLYQKIEESGAKKIYIMTPPIHVDEKDGLNGYNLVLDKYSEWLLSQKKAKDWDVIDLHFPMKRYLEDEQKIDSNFKLADDGVHPKELGHWLMAKEILLHLGEDVSTATDIQSTFEVIPNAEKIFNEVDIRQHYTKDAWLTYIGHERPGMNKGLPMDIVKRLYSNIEENIAALISDQKRIKVACIGNSITQGVGVSYPMLDSYPAQLQKMLGYDNYEVENFGVSAMTMQMHTDLAYVKTNRYQDFLKSNPDIVSIKLGTNDSRIPYRADVADSLVIQAKRFIHTIKDMPSKPRIILLLPATSYLTEEDRQTDESIVNDIIPRIRQVAFDEGLELVDTHATTQDLNILFPDNLHPNEIGMNIIAKSLYEIIVRENHENFDISAKMKEPYSTSSFYGYECLDFDFMGRNAKIVKPKRAAKNKPWIWRARFWGHEPQTDIAMLDRGYHIVYCDASKLLGNKESIKLWNNFYNYMQQLGLYKKVALEAMSRGGIYAYNWAAENPNKVLCVYADAPVLDLMSWPGGKGESEGSAEDWADFKQAYGYISDKETVKFKNSPLDKVKKIAKGNYPLLHIVGDKDDVVPMAENTAIFEEKIKALGGDIEVIHKPKVGHHPHSLKNPQLIVNFIEKSWKKEF